MSVDIQHLNMLFLRTMWEILELWTRNAIGFYKQNFIVHSIRSPENSSGDNNVDCKDPAPEVLEGSKELINN